jgi:RecB family exonuclease
MGEAMPLYSYSRVGCFENCPRQYKFRYIEKPDIPKPEGIEAFMGKMVHEALEQCYRLAQNGRVMSDEELLAYYVRRWQESLPDKLKIVKEGMTEDDYFNAGAEALKMYHARYAPFDQELTIGLERRVVFDLDPDGKYKMQGYIDRLTRDNNGKLRIQDYKTSASLPTQQDADNDNQLALYQIAVQEMWPDNNGIELVWHYVRFDTTLVSQRDDQQLEELKKLYVAKIKVIERWKELGNFPTMETNLCNWCEYYELCPAKGGPGVPGSDPQLEISPLSKEGIAGLVDEYVTCDSEKKRLDGRLKEIRGIIKQNSAIGTSSLFRGSDGREIVMTLTRFDKLPTKSADESTVDQMCEWVREEGLWDEYSSLDVLNLQKDFNNGDLPPSLMDRLGKVATIVTQDRLRIKKS